MIKHSNKNQDKTLKNTPLENSAAKTTNISPKGSENQSQSLKKSGFVAILGETNAGKSTFLNTIIGSKISIVSHKVQTTRFKVLGIYTKDNKQIVFIDTPGIFSPKRNFDKAMVEHSYDQINETDITMVMLDAQKGITTTTYEIIERISEHKKNILVINKIDLVSPQSILKILSQLKDTKKFTEFFMICSIKGQSPKNKGLNTLMQYLENNLESDVWFYEEDQISALPLNKLATEITREKIYKFLNQELPYNIVVEHSSWEEDERKIIIHQNIYVVKSGHKAILLGKNGEKIKQIRIAAMSEMKKNFGKNVSLFLFIKLDEKLFNKKYTFESIGLKM